jgi:hypothetical protein
VRPRNLIAVLGAIVALAAIIPAAASASLSQELWAGNKIEQYATRHYPGYDFVANCDQEGRNHFWCTVIGQRGQCFWQGHGEITITRRTRWQTYWRWSLPGFNRNCF